MPASRARFWIALGSTFAIGLAASYFFVTGQATCVPRSSSSRFCLLFDLVREFQTLIAAMIALGAAYIAVRPVYRQLLAMHVQNELSSRRVVADRLSRIEARTAENYRSVEEPHTDMQYHMDHDQTRFISPFSEPYASDMSGKLSSVGEKLQAAQDEQLGTEKIEASRSVLITATSELEQCLHLISVPGWITVDEDTTEQDVLDAQPRAKEAEAQLYDRWLAVNSALSDFKAVSKVEQDRLRTRVRRIDDMIADQ